MDFEEGERGDLRRRLAPSPSARGRACARALACLLVGGGAVALFRPAPARAEIDAHTVAAALPPETILGEWWTEKKDGKVRFQKRDDGTWIGILTYSSQSPPRKDTNNPDPGQRGRDVVGIVLIWNLRYDGKAFVDGRVYNPLDGKTYRASVTLIDGSTLTMRGYLGLSIFGSSETWTRVK
jgi:uncharacterized protein (DUF2147 family)